AGGGGGARRVAAGLRGRGGGALPPRRCPGPAIFGPPARCFARFRLLAIVWSGRTLTREPEGCQACSHLFTRPQLRGNTRGPRVRWERARELPPRGCADRRDDGRPLGGTSQHSSDSARLP